MASEATRAAFRRGVLDITPVVLGIIPFGLIAGVAAVDNGMGLGEALAFSTLVFAGASQLAAIDLLGQGAPALVAIGTVVVINLRMLMYSASLAPHLAHEPLRRRAGAAYVLTDQAYAMSLARFVTDDEVPRLPYYLGLALPLWVNWQLMTVAGALLGASLPEAIPLGFALPLVFLALARASALRPSDGRRGRVVGHRRDRRRRAARQPRDAARRGDRRRGRARGGAADAAGDPGGGPVSGPDAAWLVAAVAGVLTFGIRLSFLAVAGRLAAVPPVVREALRMIPPAALAALVVPAVLRTDGVLDPVSPRALAGLVAAVVAFRTKNVLATIGVGLVAIVLLDLVPGL